MATACALAMGMVDYDTDWMKARYEYYRDSHKAGLLNACYGKLATWERRYLARGCQWRNFANVEALVFLRDQMALPRAEYTKACWRAPYRAFNCLGDTVQGSDYYMPFNGSFSCGPEMAMEVGGVCGALSNLGATAAMANGVPATTMGEPGHCAYAVKVDADTWQPSYSLSWKRGMHTSFFEATWPGLMLTEACFSRPGRVRRAADLARRAHQLESSGDLEAADKCWARALKSHGLHYELWHEWAAFGERTKRDQAWWKGYHDALLRGLKDHEEPAWTILHKRVYPRLMKGMDGASRTKLFAAWLRGLDKWGGGRWAVENAWSWMLKRVPAEAHAEFLRTLCVRTFRSEAFGGALVSWLLDKYGPESSEWEGNLASILKAAGAGGASADGVLKQLARKALPDAAARGDVRTFQAIGKQTRRLSEPRSMKGIKPFAGELLSDGGALLVSGRGNRWDSPEHHWGVLGEHGGHCHTDNGASFIAVRLEQRGALTGVVIENRAGGNMWRAGGARVEISDDGKTWRQVGVLKGTKAFYRVALGGEDHEATWVRIAKDTNCLHVQRFLVYGNRRS